MAPLFDKPMNELREAFVRARFAEPAMFGRPDIEEWQSASGFDTIPFNRAPELLRHFNRIWESTNLSWVLRTNATPLAEPPDMYLWRMKNKEGDPEAYIAIIRALQMGGAHVYYPWDNSIGLSPILLIDNEIYAIDSPYDLFQSILSLRRASVSTVLEVLNGEITHDRPKASEARALFRTEAGNAIAAAREAAQRDFDEAVAVSADGTKIVKAKWVLVGSYDEDWEGRAILYPAEAFRRGKIQIRGRHAHQDLNMSHVGRVDLNLEGENLVANLLELLFRDVRGRRNHWNQYLEDQTGRDLFGSLYLVDFHSCPSPLPEGGREIRV